MSLPVPPPVSPVQQTSGQDLTLRLYERVTARVMEVTATRAVLDINGYPVVARLTSKDQASELLSSKYAQFIITHVSQNEITLKFANKAAGAESPAIIGESKDFAADICRSFGLPGTDNEVKLIRLALQENLPVSKEVVNQILEAVYGAGIDVDKAITLAVKLKMAGLPVSAESIMMAGKFEGIHLADTFSALLSDLRTALAGMDKNNPLAVRIHNVMQQLESMIPDLASGGEKIKACLQELFQLIGRPYENLLSEQLIDGNDAENSPFNLLHLLQLEKDLRQGGQTKAADGIERFLEQVRQDQFMNIKAESTPGKGSWGEINFVVHLRSPENQETSDAKVRISYRQDKKPKVIDPGFTSLTLQVNLEPQKEVIFDLSLLQKKVNVEISSEDAGLADLFRRTLPEFKEVLDQLGYKIVHASVHQTAPAEERTTKSGLIANLQDSSVDIEV